MLSVFSGWNLQQWLVFVLGSVGIVWYYICLFGVGWSPAPTPSPQNAFRDFMSFSLTTIGVSLATFVGALLGVKTFVDAAAPSSPPTPDAPALQALTVTTPFQWIAAGLYVLSLLMALGLWRKNGNAADPAISTLAKSLLGLVAGALSIAFGIGQG